MQTFEIVIPEIDDISAVNALTARRALFLRLSRLDEDSFDDLDEVEAIVSDELGIKTVFRVVPERICRYRCEKVDRA